MQAMIKKIGLFFVFPILGIFLVGCTTVRTKMPQWALFPEQDYPPEQYAFAPGAGSNLRLAKKNAATSLKNLFNIRMEEARLVTARLYREFGFPSGFHPVFNEEAPPQKPKSVPPPRIRFGKHYTDEENTVHTIAFFNRAEAVKPLAEQMQTGAARVRELLADADSKTDPLPHFSFLRAALLYALQNEESVAKVTLIDPEITSAFQPGFSLTNLLTRVAAAATNVTFTVSATGDSRQNLSSLVGNTLRGIGFVPASNGVLTVTASLRTNSAKHNDARSVRLHYKLDIDVQDRTGRSVASVHEGKTENFPAVEARAQAARAIEKTVNQTLRQQILRTLNRIAGIK